MGMFHDHGDGARERLRGMLAVRRLKDVGTARGVSGSSVDSTSGLEAAPSVEDRTISLFSRGEYPAFAGINTFVKAPYCENIRDVGR